MKNFVTRIVALAFIISIGSSAFAQYKGDIQLVLGHDQQYLSLNDGDIGWKSNSFDIGLKSFNTFDVVSFLGVGFLGSCDLAFGKSIHTKNSASPEMDFLIDFDAFLGPALTINKWMWVPCRERLVLTGITWEFLANRSLAFLAARKTITFTEKVPALALTFRQSFFRLHRLAQSLD